MNLELNKYPLFANENEDNDKEYFIQTDEHLNKKKLKEKILKQTREIKKNEEEEIIVGIKNIYSYKNFVIKLFLFIFIIVIILNSHIKVSKTNEKSENSEKSKNSENTDFNNFGSSESNTNLYICTHIDFPNEINNKKFYKILCDKKEQLKNKYSLEIIETYKDNELYPKNRGYSECSKIFYIWKKYKNGEISSEYVGFNHYRRVFKFKNNVPNLTDTFKNYDIILHKEYDLRETIQDQFANYHFADFLDEVMEIIKDNFTEYYPTAMKSIKRTKINICNIFIMKKEYFIIYGEFLFGVLMEFDRRHNLKTDEDIKNFIVQEIIRTGKKNYNVDYQSRVEAFLSERISQIFYDHHFKKPLQIEVTRLS